MLARPGTKPNVPETMPTFSHSSTSMTWASQPPPSSINIGYQAQGIPPPPIIPPRVFANSQPGQGNIQILNPTPAVPAVPERPASRFYDCAKPLGAIQIIIGLMHLGFGIVLGSIGGVYMSVYGFASFAFISGYPFWGGLSFIITGALSISATKDFSTCLLKGSLAMNILSAIFVLIGVILFFVDESLNGLSNQDIWALISGKGITGVMIIFCFLEFAIACTTAHFSSQAVSSTNNQGPVVFVTPAVHTMATSLSYPPSTTVGNPVHATRH